MTEVIATEFDYEGFVKTYKPKNFVEYPSSNTPREWEAIKRRAGLTYCLQTVTIPDLPGVALYTFGVNHSDDSDWIRYFLFSNGKGFARDGQYSDWGEVAQFSWNPEEVLKDVTSKDIASILEEHILERFRSDINDGLGEAAIIPEGDLDAPLYFSSGSLDELEKLTRLIVYNFPEFGETEDIHAYFTSKSEHCDTDSSLLGLTTEEYWDDEEDWAAEYFHLSPETETRLTELLDYAARQNCMTGETLEYNDGAYNRMSGYDWKPQQCSIDIPVPSMHERAEARPALRVLLSLNLSQDEINRLLPLE